MKHENDLNSNGFNDTERAEHLSQIAFDIYYSNRKNSKLLSENYELIKNISSQLLTKQDLVCLHHNFMENVEHKFIITKQKNVIRMYYGFLSILDDTLTPHMDYRIFIDDEREIARVKSVNGETLGEGNMQGGDVYCAFSIKDIDDKDHFDEIYYESKYRREGFFLIDKENDEYVIAEADINENLRYDLKEWLKKIEGYSNDGFFEEAVIIKTKNKGIIAYLIKSLTKIHALCQCKKCEKLAIVQNDEVDDYECDHEDKYIYYA